MAHIVFPKELKGFSWKLSAAGWDIGKIKHHPTSGFSGTNDSRATLLLSIEQLDLPEQRHTNALVLGHLLQKENSVAIVDPNNTDITNVCSVLEKVTSMVPPAQVVLDVGAQILESNYEVSNRWLRMLPSSRCQAVIFFDDTDEVVVLDRKGKIEPLMISPFSKRLEQCHVYLDECHTRGTDLRLPDHYRAVVTLGANLTKDKLIQGMGHLPEKATTVSKVNSECQHVCGCESSAEGNLSFFLFLKKYRPRFVPCVKVRRHNPRRFRHLAMGYIRDHV